MNIDKQIKKQYKKQEIFAEHLGISPKDLSSKKRTVKNKIEYLDSFFNELGFKVKIVKIKK